MNQHGTTYARAVAAYDPEFERTLTDAIITTIAETSVVNDANVMAIRTGESISALMKVVTLMLAMSPSVARSPAAIRKLTDDLRRRLIKNVANAASDPSVADFMQHAFRHDDRERRGSA
jgi:hypothetical protein